MLAVDYCRARKLDIMKKPVHIVPMWSSALGREVETVWPGINEIQTTAARTGQYAGMDEPKWGKDIIRKFKGTRGKNVGESEVEVTFPEWCAVTVYRIVDGQRCPFTEPVYWTEAYGRIGKSELPNDQWLKRPRGQFLKVAKAFSLRAAFPEEGEHTAEEMAGRIVEETDANGIIIDVTQPLKKSPAFKNAALRNAFGEKITASIDTAKTLDELTALQDEHKAKFEEMRTSGNEYDLLTVDNLSMLFKRQWNRLAIATRETPADIDNGAMTPEEEERYAERYARMAPASAEEPPAMVRVDKGLNY